MATSARAFAPYINRSGGSFDAVPSELRSAARWLNYQLVDDPKHPDKPRKVPMQSRTIGERASSTAPATWACFDDAVGALTHPASNYTGIGFALGDGWVGVDCDDCVDPESGEIALWALSIIDRLDSYTEFSPSGTGVHVLVRGDLPSGWRKWGDVEMYARARYFTVTGRAVPGAPSSINERSSPLATMHAEFTAQRAAEDATKRSRPIPPLWGQAVERSENMHDVRAGFGDDALLERARQSRAGVRFTRLWAGDWTGYPSQSEADLALTSDLMFWCDGDTARVDRLFRASGLIRAKWDERRGELTYGEATVARARESWRQRPARQPVKHAARATTARGIGAADDAADSPSDTATIDVALPPEFSEDAVAVEFTRRYADSHRYTAEFGRWSRWDGVSRWAHDSTLEVFDRVRLVCRDVAASTENQRVASVLGRANTVAAVERLARADRAHAATPEQWDADDWMLNTPEGVVDLRSGELRPGRPDDYLTHQTAVAPHGDSADTPTWLAFLDRVTGGDVELQAFLRRMSGYCLTGDIRAHALFFLYGTGGNGKGTFLNTLTSIIGDYATVAPIEMFSASKNDRHPTELAGLKGARLVASQETEEGRHWAEAKIKAMTGGDPISARFMRGDFFNFRPRFKLVIAGNHRPRLRSVDEAMRRRLHLIPFTQTIAASERDESLPERLRAEWPGILAWAIAGCLEWQRIGLAPPTSITAATDDYFTAEDSVRAWLDDCCTLSPMAWARSGDLFKSWKQWTEDQGEPGGSSKAFTEKLKAQGFTLVRRSGRGFAGLSLRTPLERGHVD